MNGPAIPADSEPIPVPGDLDLVASLHHEAPPSPAVTASGRARLAAAIADAETGAPTGQKQPPRRAGQQAAARERTWRRERVRVGVLALAGGAVLAAGTVAVTLIMSSPPSGRAPAASNPRRVIAGHGGLSARGILLTASMNALRAQASGRYWMASTVDGGLLKVGPATRPYVILERIRMESWTSASGGDVQVVQILGAHPATATDWAAWHADGAPTSWTDPGIAPVRFNRPSKAQVARSSSGPMPANPDYPKVQIGTGEGISLAQVKNLPRAPSALKHALLHYIACRREARLQHESIHAYCSPAQTSAMLFTAAQTLLQSAAPPPIKSAACKILAGLPEIKNLGQVTDPLGRQGIAIGLPDGTPGLTDELIIDPGSGRLLATQTVVNHAGQYSDSGPSQSLSLHSGQVFYYQAIVQIGWTNSTPRSTR